MALKGKVEIICYDSAYKAEKMICLCSVCGAQEEKIMKSAPQIKTIIVECSDCSKRKLIAK